MTATEELRRLLDERGVDYKERVAFGKCIFHWGEPAVNGAMFTDGGDWTELVVENPTPAQAVEATLGRGTCRIEEQGGEWRCTGCGEVVGSCDPSSELEVSGNFVEMWDHCPMCGRRVVE